MHFTKKKVISTIYFHHVCACKSLISSHKNINQFQATNFCYEIFNTTHTAQVANQLRTNWTLKSTFLPLFLPFDNNHNHHHNNNYNRSSESKYARLSVIRASQRNQPWSRRGPECGWDPNTYLPLRRHHLHQQQLHHSHGTHPIQQCQRQCSRQDQLGGEVSSLSPKAKRKYTR